jgi:hypothetical protein
LLPPLLCWLLFPEDTWEPAESLEDEPEEFDELDPEPLVLEPLEALLVPEVAPVPAVVLDVLAALEVPLDPPVPLEPVVAVDAVAVCWTRRPNPAAVAATTPPMTSLILEVNGRLPLRCMWLVMATTLRAPAEPNLEDICTHTVERRDPELHTGSPESGP